MPFTTFDVNIFGTSHNDLDDNNTNLYTREFVIHVLQVECNQTITNFDMFIEFFAYPFRKGTSLGPYPIPSDGQWLNAFTVDKMKLNNRPQVIHLDTMTPNSPIALYSSCTIPAPPCPSPADMRLGSAVFQTPILTTSPTNYDTNYTDMYYYTELVHKLPVNITIIADECRYSSAIDTTINIYTDYNSNFGLFGGATDIYPIGFNEKITIS